MTRPCRICARLRPVAFVLFCLLATGSLAQPGPPPLAAVRNVSERYFGVSVDDPYRYFEDKSDPEVVEWMEAQDRHARTTLAGIPGRDTLLQNIRRYDASTPERVMHIKRVPGELYFMERRDTADEPFKLVMRRGMSGKEKLLIDPLALEKRTGKPHVINWFSPSPDGRLVAFGMSRQGSEAIMSVLDTRGGRTLGAPITRAELGGVDWSPDGKALVFNRLQAAGKGTPQLQKYQNSQTHVLRLGQPASAARPVFGSAIKGLDIGPVDTPLVKLTHDGRWAIGMANNAARRELTVFLAPQRSVLSGKPQWRGIIGAADAVTRLAYFDNTLYMVSHKGAPRSRVIAMNLDAPNIRSATEVMAESDLALLDIVAAADALYIEARDGNVKRLFKRAHSPAAAASQPIEVPLPVQGAFELAGTAVDSADPRLPGVMIDLQSWTRARQVFAVAADGRVSNTGLQPTGPFDTPADIVATEVKVKSHDGALVPLSIIHRKDVVLNAGNPTLMYGYASYGITAESVFAVSRLAWLDAGGVLAVANPRGSGVYGQDWYRGGLQATKPNSWKDFIACAEYLIAAKFTQPSKLGIFGSGAGGILVGRAMTERPDLFAAVVAAGGALDSLRFEATPGGAAHIAEFGSVKTGAGFKALLAMSTYANIQTGTVYPAVLLTHGVSDGRAEVWQSTKTAARLMAATSGDKPVLLRMDVNAGSGLGNAQQIEERADWYSFLLWQMGAKSFQP
ncbi:MAG: prolyl oligopeptidase family serine peptidase [Burkholderiaceae bacterium]